MCTRGPWGVGRNGRETRPIALAACILHERTEEQEGTRAVDPLRAGSLRDMAYLTLRGQLRSHAAWHRAEPTSTRLRSRKSWLMDCGPVVKLSSHVSSPVSTSASLGGLGLLLHP